MKIVSKDEVSSIDWTSRARRSTTGAPTGPVKFKVVEKKKPNDELDLPKDPPKLEFVDVNQPCSNCGVVLPVVLMESMINKCLCAGCYNSIKREVTNKTPLFGRGTVILYPHWDGVIVQITDLTVTRTYRTKSLEEAKELLAQEVFITDVLHCPEGQVFKKEVESEDCFR
jgi:hypothetical protein